MKFADALEWMRERPGKNMLARGRRFRWAPKGSDLQTLYDDTGWGTAGLLAWMLDADWRPVGEEEPKGCEHLRWSVFHLASGEDVKVRCLDCGESWANIQLTHWTITPSPLSAGDVTGGGKHPRHFCWHQPDSYRGPWPCSVCDCQLSKLSAGDKPVAKGFAPEPSIRVKNARTGAEGHIPESAILWTNYYYPVYNIYNALRKPFPDGKYATLNRDINEQWRAGDCLNPPEPDPIARTLRPGRHDMGGEA